MSFIFWTFHAISASFSWNFRHVYEGTRYFIWLKHEKLRKKCNKINFTIKNLSSLFKEMSLVFICVWYIFLDIWHYYASQLEYKKYLGSVSFVNKRLFIANFKFLYEYTWVSDWVAIKTLSLYGSYHNSLNWRVQVKAFNVEFNHKFWALLVLMCRLSMQSSSCTVVNRRETCWCCKIVIALPCTSRWRRFCNRCTWTN